MATKSITIEIDEELYDETKLLAEASAETSLSVYIIDAIAFVNRERLALPETKIRVEEWAEKCKRLAWRVGERCDWMNHHHRRTGADAS